MMINNQRGSAIVMGLIFMMFMGILATGLTFATGTSIKSMTKDKSMLEAQYAAEAGAIRAKVGILNSATDWSWIGIKNPVAADLTKTYSVTITPPIANNSAATPVSTYVIKSVSTVDGISKTVTISATAPAATSTGITTIWQPPTDPNYKNTIKYTVLANGDLIAYSNNSATNLTNGTPYALGTTASSISFQWGLAVKTGVTDVYLNLLSSSFFSLTNPRITNYAQTSTIPTSDTATQYGSTWSNLWSHDAKVVFQTGTLYYVNGDVDINTDNPIYTSDYTTANGAGTGKTIIYATGNIVINRSMYGNFVFISDKTITIDPTQYSYQGQLELYGETGITLNNVLSNNFSATKKSYGVFMTPGNLTVHGGNFGEAFMFGGTGVVLDGGGTINGAIYSNGSITISGGETITYDASAIPQ